MFLTILSVIFWIFVIDVVLGLVLEATKGGTAHKTIAKTSAPIHTPKEPVRKDPFDAVMRGFNFVGFLVLLVVGTMTFIVVYDWFTHL